MLEELKKEVYEANMELTKQALVKYTWGNVSGVSRERNLFVIKPSGVSYDVLKPEDMVVCNFDGEVVEGTLNPSSDTMTHAALYKKYESIGGIVHTHSRWATIWSQAKLDLPVLGTTHADTFYGSVPSTRFLSKDEIDQGYEAMTGQLIIETFEDRSININEVPAVLVSGHGPFAWANDAASAVMNAVVLEELCMMNYYTRSLNSVSPELPKEILDTHYLRKHGKNARYGQK